VGGGGAGVRKNGPDKTNSWLLNSVATTHLTIFILALDEDILEEVVVVVLHLLVRHIGQVRAISRLQQLTVRSSLHGSTDAFLAFTALRPLYGSRSGRSPERPYLDHGGLHYK
jgi:hypothetical protein